MGNFLVVTSGDAFDPEAQRVFKKGIANAQRWIGSTASSIIDYPSAKAAYFPRQNGSGSPIAEHKETGSWLLTLGTWFHSYEINSGQEGRLLHRYIDVGAERLAQELEGFFVVVIGDGRTRETVVLTDVIGSCHAFARRWNNGFILSGSSFLLAQLGDSTLDPIACQEFLFTGAIYEDRTFYKQVRKLRPGTIHRFAQGGEKSRRYWRIADIAVESLDGRTAAKELTENLANAARKIARRFSNPVCDLTGGYDSRAVVSGFVAAQVPFSTTVSGPENHPDVVVSRGLAQLIGVPHFNVSADEARSFAEAKVAFPFTDGEYEMFEYSRILRIHQELSRRFDVSINGSFGEIARGYWWELLFPHTGERRKVDCRKLARLRYAAGARKGVLMRPDLRLDMVSHLTGVLERTNADLCDLPNTLQMDHLYLIVRMQRWQGRIASSTNRLWPCLSPFLFRSVLEATLRTNAGTRRFSRLVRKMLAEYHPQLADFPLENGYPAAPVKWNNIHRFWPLVGYYKTKAISRVERLMSRNGNQGIRSSPSSKGTGLEYDEELRDLLYSPSIVLREFLDTLYLSRTSGQRQPLEIRVEEKRLATLEYTVRALKRTQDM